MSEYLAPGVYVEEISSGNKPIEAAGTSTAGMIGMTARGPVNQPMLVTSQAGFSRVFGGLLDPLEFSAGRDALPYAAEGFFANGGGRLYVVRIVGETAAEATLDLEALDTSVAATPVLAAAAVVTGGTPITTLTLTDLNAVTAGMRLLIMDGVASEVVTITADDFIPRLQLARGLRHSFVSGDTVTLQAVTDVETLAQEAAAGDTVLVLDAAVASLAVGNTIQVGAEETAELVEIDAIDAETLTLGQPLRLFHAADTAIATLADDTTTSPLTAGVAAGGPSTLLEMDTTGIDAGTVVHISDADNEEYARVAAIAQVVTLDEELVNSHPRGISMVPVQSVLRVHARYPGIWGDSLRVTLRPANLVSTMVTKTAGADETSVALGSAFGLFPGSVVTIDEKLSREVAAVDTAAGTVTFTQTHEQELTPGMAVVSQEFTLSVERMDNDKAVESETFERLSMAEEHPRYVLKIIGAWDTATKTPSASGGSNLIRLEDRADGTTRTLPLVADVGRFLVGGDDDTAGVTAASYVGNPSQNPNQRSGIFAMENEPAVSIVAVPGQTSVTVQKALIVHCEHMRYRFAVLDTPIGADLAAARAHRQNFDSTRCALYYPSLERADNFGAPGDRRVISPSGHVLGIYARTDTTRGVHKAPANEVVRSILAFDNKLDKGAQDILNPINLNCFRDFRSENRGLRVYGARVATSDPEFQYINVRRLLLMIAQSLDTGLQWAVFEPNDKMLWDTVKQSVTGFLTTVWRSGALEGQKAEEAFYVNIGYDVTMTQDDIDNGRLIVEIGVAPVKPAEFVIVKISQKTREAQD
uniref:phage tail sheath family protein n=1 Tax=uncultured Halomonas sp. TaxID=173971 RepID=UPI00260C3A1D|nr:phage tail sheath C-terminal domain-containing protein [uncultured Halomonas sp.]